MILKRLRQKNSLLNDFFVFDTETRGLSARPESFIFGCIYGNGFKKVIYTIKDFKREFKNKRYKGKFVFAHNAEYDLNVIYSNIYLLDSHAIFNGRFIRATNGNCKFGDSMNILLSSVKDIGKMTGLKKLNTPSKFKKGLKNIKVTENDINYCLRDCEIVYNALLNIFELCGNIRITLAGLSLQLFRSKYQKFDIEHKEKFSKYFFNSYFGGRTECFKIGYVNAVSYDINSAYPSAMKFLKFPNPKYFKQINKPNKQKFLSLLKNFEGVAFLRFKVKDNYFGILPYKINYKVLFPIGEFSGWYNFNELRYCIEKKLIDIQYINKVIYSFPMESPFIEFVNDIFNKKNNSTGLQKYIFKIILNALYGKFSQKIDYEIFYAKDVLKYINFINDKIKKGIKVLIQRFNFERKDGFIMYQIPEKSITWSIPSFSSYITSFTRIQLLDTLLNYKNFEPVYCDTDSIFFNRDPKIKSNKELGNWNKESKIISRIDGLKNYVFTDKKIITHRIKGIKKGAKQIKDNTYKFNSLVKTKEGLRRQIPSGTRIKRIKVIKNTYDKRIVLNDGNTKPIKL